MLLYRDNSYAFDKNIIALCLQAGCAHFVLRLAKRKEPFGSLGRVGAFDYLIGRFIT